jgi:poly(3-hydroxybutyrate) depolymerase
VKRVLLVSAVAAALFAPAARATPLPTWGVRVIKIHYVAHDGFVRRAFVELPAWYGPLRHPPIPLVIAPHGRGVGAWTNLGRWGNLPTLGGFAVVEPEGQGRRLTLFAWGARGDVSDLARMPEILEESLPWLRVDRRRIYAFGGSMGGQETLLLVARFPHLLAGAAAFDAPTNMAVRYAEFAELPFGRGLQRLAQIEIGGTPATNPRAYARRSPIDFARKIAFSGVPLQIWWSKRDRVVTDQALESGRLYRRIMRLNPYAPVQQIIGYWAHTAEMRANRRLPIALGLFNLLPPEDAHYGGGST